MKKKRIGYLGVLGIFCLLLLSSEGQGQNWADYAPTEGPWAVVVASTSTKFENRRYLGSNFFFAHAMALREYGYAIDTGYDNLIIERDNSDGFNTDFRIFHNSYVEWPGLNFVNCSGETLPDLGVDYRYSATTYDLTFRFQAAGGYKLSEDIVVTHSTATSSSPRRMEIFDGIGTSSMVNKIETYLSGYPKEVTGSWTPRTGCPEWIGVASSSRNIFKREVVAIITPSGCQWTFKYDNEGIFQEAISGCDEAGGPGDPSCGYTNPPSLPSDNRKCFQYRKNGQLETVCANNQNQIVHFTFNPETGKHNVWLYDDNGGCLVDDNIDPLEDGTCIKTGRALNVNFITSQIECESCNPLSQAPNCIAIRDNCGYTSYRCSFLREGNEGGVRSISTSIGIDSDPGEDDLQSVVMKFYDGSSSRIFSKQVPGDDYGQMPLIRTGTLRRCVNDVPTGGWEDLKFYPAQRPNLASSSSNFKCIWRLDLQGNTQSVNCNTCNAVQNLFLRGTEGKVTWLGGQSTDDISVSTTLKGADFIEELNWCQSQGFIPDPCNQAALLDMDLANSVTNVESSSNLSFKSNDSPVKIFPNPTTTRINLEIRLDDKEKVSYEVMDLNGSRISSSNSSQLLARGMHNFEINDFTKLPPGIYLLRIDLGSQGIHTQRIVKM